MTWDSIQNSYDVSTKTTSWEDASAMDKVTDKLIDFVILLIILCATCKPYHIGSGLLRVQKSANLGTIYWKRTFLGTFSCLSLFI